jgi:hypothetical protein
MGEGVRAVTHRQAVVSGAAALATIAACAASFYANTPNALAACAIIAITGLVVFAVAMGEE